MTGPKKPDGVHASRGDGQVWPRERMLRPAVAVVGYALIALVAGGLLPETAVAGPILVAEGRMLGGGLVGGGPIVIDRNVTGTLGSGNEGTLQTLSQDTFRAELEGAAGDGSVRDRWRRRYVQWLRSYRHAALGSGTTFWKNMADGVVDLESNILMPVGEAATVLGVGLNDLYAEAETAKPEPMIFHILDDARASEDPTPEIDADPNLVGVTFNLEAFLKELGAQAVEIKRTRQKRLDLDDDSTPIGRPQRSPSVRDTQPQSLLAQLLIAEGLEPANDSRENLSVLWQPGDRDIGNPTYHGDASQSGSTGGRQGGRSSGQSKGATLSIVGILKRIYENTVASPLAYLVAGLVLLPWLMFRLARRGRRA